MEKTQVLFFFKPEQKSKLSVQMFNYIFISMTEQLVFCFYKSNFFKLRFG